MKITDLFKQDILNPKPIILKEYGGIIEKTKDKKSTINSEAVLMVMLFGLTTILLTTKTSKYETRRKED
jgi:hypothetical protein